MEVRAKGVVLTTGGFGKNQQLVDEHINLQNHVMICAGWARGDGIRLAQEAGAAIDDLNVCIGYKAEMPKTAGLSMRSFYLLLFSNYPVVNKAGVRFIDESIWFSYFAHALHNQPEGTGYVIIDEAMRTGNPFTDLAKEVESGRIKKADTFADLAVQAGLPADAFVASVEKYNGYAQAGKDDEFGENGPTPDPSDQSPPITPLKSFQWSSTRWEALSSTPKPACSSRTETPFPDCTQPETTPPVFMTVIRPQAADCRYPAFSGKWRRKPSKKVSNGLHEAIFHRGKHVTTFCPSTLRTDTSREHTRKPGDPVTAIFPGFPYAGFVASWRNRTRAAEV